MSQNKEYILAMRSLSPYVGGALVEVYALVHRAGELIDHHYTVLDVAQSAAVGFQSDYVLRKRWADLGLLPEPPAAPPTGKGEGPISNERVMSQLNDFLIEHRNGAPPLGDQVKAQGFTRYWCDEALHLLQLDAYFEEYGLVTPWGPGETGDMRAVLHELSQVGQGMGVVRKWHTEDCTPGDFAERSVHGQGVYRMGQLAAVRQQRDRGRELNEQWSEKLRDLNIYCNTRHGKEFRQAEVLAILEGKEAPELESEPEPTVADSTSGGQRRRRRRRRMRMRM